MVPRRGRSSSDNQCWRPSKENEWKTFQTYNRVFPWLHWKGHKLTRWSGITVKRKGPIRGINTLAVIKLCIIMWHVISCCNPRTPTPTRIHAKLTHSPMECTFLYRTTEGSFTPCNFASSCPTAIPNRYSSSFLFRLNHFTQETYASYSDDYYSSKISASNMYPAKKS